MLQLQRPDLFGWTESDANDRTARNGWFLANPGGNLTVDPIGEATRDLRHLEELGGMGRVALLSPPAPEMEAWLRSRPELELFSSLPNLDLPHRPLEQLEVSGIEVLVHATGGHSLLLDGTTLYAPNLLEGSAGALRLTRGSRGAKLEELGKLPPLESVLVHRGWHVFRDGGERILEVIEGWRGL